MVIETELSDFHKMCATVIKMYYNEQEHSIVHYRKFKTFCSDIFIRDVKKLC